MRNLVKPFDSFGDKSKGKKITQIKQVLTETGKPVVTDTGKILFVKLGV